MAESLLVGRNFVSGICKLNLKKLKKNFLKSEKKSQNIFFFSVKNYVFTSLESKTKSIGIARSSSGPRPS